METMRKLGSLGMTSILAASLSFLSAGCGDQNDPWLDGDSLETVMTNQSPQLSGSCAEYLAADPSVPVPIRQLPPQNNL